MSRVKTQFWLDAILGGVVLLCIGGMPLALGVLYVLGGGV